MVKQYKSLNMPGHQDWSVRDANTVSVSFTTNLEFDLVTDGYSETQALDAADPGTTLVYYYVLYVGVLRGVGVLRALQVLWYPLPAW